MSPIVKCDACQRERALPDGSCPWCGRAAGAGPQPARVDGLGGGRSRQAGQRALARIRPTPLPGSLPRYTPSAPPSARAAVRVPGSRVRVPDAARCARWLLYTCLVVVPVVAEVWSWRLPTGR